MALAFCGKQFLLRRSTLLNSIRRNGYIVLVPEIGEELPEKNPLLQQDGLPEFTNLTIENCVAAIGKQTLEFEQGIKDIEECISFKEDADAVTEVIEPLERMGVALDTTWGLSKALYIGNKTLMPTKSYMAIHERAKRGRASKFNSLPIYKTCKRSLLNPLQKTTEEQQRLLQKFVLEGKLNGLELGNSKRMQLNENISKTILEQTKFKGKTDASTRQFSENIKDMTIVREFPEEILKQMAADPAKPLEGPWKVTLHPHISTPFLEYCPDSLMRWNIWQASVNRGSGYAEKQLETSTNLEGIRFLRRDRAKLLGYESYSAMSMETKMAGTVENVKKMFSELLEKAKPAQVREIESLSEFAKAGGHNGPLHLWDLPYWKRKQLISMYSYTDAVIKEYFPFPHVLNGLFELTERLFNVKIRQRNGTSTWHRDVKYFEVYEDHTEAPIAGFYLDPFARKEDEKIKLQGNNGWMVAIQNRSIISNTKPIAALVFNFQAPQGDKPSLLSFKDVQILFQKFGHSLQHLLTRAEHSEVSGLSNIEWDAVDVCGYVMSYWLHNSQTLHNISSHFESRDKLTPDMIDTLQNMRCHMAGTELCKELYLADLDLHLHQANKDFWLDVVKQLWPQYRLFPLDKLDSHPCNFTDIFCGEWGAAYYSHIWSRVVAADVFSAFYEVRDNEQQLLETAKRFRDTYLAFGGACHPSQVFRRFRGRDPSPKALLLSLGLKNGVNATENQKA